MWGEMPTFKPMLEDRSRTHLSKALGLLSHINDHSSGQMVNEWLKKVLTKNSLFFCTIMECKRVLFWGTRGYHTSINQMECKSTGYKLHFDTKIRSVPCQIAEISVCWEGHFLAIFWILTFPLLAMCTL